MPATRSSKATTTEMISTADASSQTLYAAFNRSVVEATHVESATDRHHGNRKPSLALSGTNSGRAMKVTRVE